MHRFANFPPYEIVELSHEREAKEKTRKLERLYHLSHEHAWDGRKVLAELIEEHGEPGNGLDPEVRAALSRVLTVLMWGELAAWNISADLALMISDTDAKMAATSQVFDEARHFYVMRDYLSMLGGSPRIGGLPTRLFRKVLDAPTLAQKLVGMQLLFETNAVVLFRRIGEKNFCPVLSGLMPYYERDESRHIGLGVMYLPRLIEKMSRREARGVASFHSRCLLLLMSSGFAVKDDFETLHLDRRLMAERVTRMQDDVIRQMSEAHGEGFRSPIARTSAGVRPHIFEFIHPKEGFDSVPSWHRRLHGTLVNTAKLMDRALPS